MKHFPPATLASLLWFPAVLAAQSPVEAESSMPIPVEIFHGARVTSLNNSASLYPLKELLRGGEGRVTLGFMVDMKGTPYEIAVLESSGSAKFDEVAIKMITEGTYEPGTLKGQPVDSALEIPVRFIIRQSGTKGASPEFVRDFYKIKTTIGASDRPATDAVMDKIQVTNFYESAILGLAQASYAEKWGTKQQVLAALARAVGGENAAEYLPAAQYRASLIAFMGLQLQLNRFPEAIRSWKRVQKLKLEPAVREGYERIFARVEALRKDDQEYLIEAQLSPTGSWDTGLFKSHFRAVVDEGSLSEVKFRCEKGYFFIRFDPALTYQVGGPHGACNMQLVGTPGAKIRLFQS